MSRQHLTEGAGPPCAPPPTHALAHRQMTGIHAQSNLEHPKPTHLVAVHIVGHKAALGRIALRAAVALAGLFKRQSLGIHPAAVHTDVSGQRLLPLRQLLAKPWGSGLLVEALDIHLCVLALDLQEQEVRGTQPAG